MENCLNIKSFHLDNNSVLNKNIKDINTIKIYYEDEKYLNKYNNNYEIFLIDKLKTNLETLSIKDKLNEDMSNNKLYLRKKYIDNIIYLKRNLYQ